MYFCWENKTLDLAFSIFGIWYALISIMVMAVWTQYGYGPLARYLRLRVAHAPGMPGTYSPPPRVSDPDMHHSMCVMPWCMSGSLTSGFLWSRWRGKCSRHSRRTRNTQFYVSGKRPMFLVQIQSIRPDYARLHVHTYSIRICVCRICQLSCFLGSLRNLNGKIIELSGYAQGVNFPQGRKLIHTSLNMCLPNCTK